jgi:hypothetical protein
MVSMLQIQAAIYTLVNPQSVEETRQICRLWNSLKTSLFITQGLVCCSF